MLTGHRVRTIADGGDGGENEVERVVERHVLPELSLDDLDQADSNEHSQAQAYT